MSRFFRGGGSGSDSNSESDYSSSDDENASKTSASGSGSDSESSSGSDSEAGRKKGPSRFVRGAESSDESSDEDTKRIVKSARDKRFDEMRNTVKSLKNATKINDWVAIQNEFEKLNKAYVKANAVIQREGVPRFYIRFLNDLEASVKETVANKEVVKKMNASGSRAFNAMKQRIKKFVKSHETDIEAFKANPVNEEESADEAAKKAAALAASDSESGSDDEGEGRDRFLKKEDGGDFERPRKKGSKAEGKEDGDDFQVVGKRGKVAELKPEDLFKKLHEVIQARGKKGTDRQLQMQNLERLLEIALTPSARVRVLLALIPSRFDSSSSTAGYLATDVWKSAAAEMNQLFALLEENVSICIEEMAEEEDEAEAAEEKFKNGENIIIRASLSSLIERIDDEFTRSLQHIDPHTLDYVSRLRDETILYALIVRAQKYFERINYTLAVDSTKMRRVEHLYYKPDSVIQAVEKEVRTLHPTLNEKLEEPSDLVQNLCISLYKTSIDRVRTRSLLCHVYHLALHDNFQRARDLMLMSHLQDHIAQTEVSTQILFNRTMAQIGLCAFRAGMVRETANCLQEISSSGKVKELLAQGVQMQRFSDKTPEQEKLEKLRQLPFHMHINLELLECVYLTCSMLLEIPNMAANAHEPRRKVISKPFRRMLDYNERQVFIGPPENTRDHIMGAAKALAAGEWQRCRDLIHAIKIWDLMPNTEKIKNMLSRKIQEEGLRTYFFTYSPYYDSLGIDQLAGMFELTINDVRATVSRMIINEELLASIDQPTNTVVLHRTAGPGVETSRLEFLAGLYADKVSSFVDSNEKLLESRSMQLGLQQQQQQRDFRGGQRGGHGDRGGDRGGYRGGRGGRGGGGRGGGGRGGYGGGDAGGNRERRDQTGQRAGR
ncbi:eukaryotic translation initiation factor 3 subunit 8 N-terminus-domain-containing protein [Phlyctochytrium arcticum]|nr:eukaryotic translation initiation factor 3 subunit 8 N-terminus-domain-containing protein [Phlyctochytrium arcticum]KAI9104143.1 eukaryotic translation initiation factor 3 subunit 8 N-terminus-domain-containing protein [Phlyctochytrium arcticum]